MKHKKAASALKKECKAIVDLDVAASAPLGGKTLLELVEGARAACVPLRSLPAGSRARTNRM